MEGENAGYAAGTNESDTVHTLMLAAGHGRARIENGEEGGNNNYTHGRKFCHKVGVVLFLVQEKLQ